MVWITGRHLPAVGMDLERIKWFMYSKLQTVADTGKFVVAYMHTEATWEVRSLRQCPSCIRVRGADGVLTRTLNKLSSGAVLCTPVDSSHGPTRGTGGFFSSVYRPLLPLGYPCAPRGLPLALRRAPRSDRAEAARHAQKGGSRPLTTDPVARAD